MFASLAEQKPHLLQGLRKDIFARHYVFFLLCTSLFCVDLLAAEYFLCLLSVNGCPVQANQVHNDGDEVRSWGVGINHPCIKWRRSCACKLCRRLHLRTSPKLDVWGQHLILNFISHYPLNSPLLLSLTSSRLSYFLKEATLATVLPHFRPSSPTSGHRFLKTQHNARTFSTPPCCATSLPQSVLHRTCAVQ